MTRKLVIVLRVNCLSLLLACGPSFVAVDTTGKLGAKIDAASGVIDTWTAICADAKRIQQELTPEAAQAYAHQAAAMLSQPTCANWTTATAKIKQIASALAAYSAKLSAVATSKDLAFGKPETGALAVVGGSNWTQDKTDSKIVVAVVGLFSKAYRKEQLDDIVGTTMKKPVDDAVAELDAACAIAKTEIKLLRAELFSVRQQIAQLVIATTLPPPVAGLLFETVARMDEQLTGQDKQIDTLQQAVDAFGKAHDALASHSKDLDSKDALAAVTNALEGAFQ